MLKRSHLFRLIIFTCVVNTAQAMSMEDPLYPPRESSELYTRILFNIQQELAAPARDENRIHEFLNTIAQQSPTIMKKDITARKYYQLTADDLKNIFVADMRSALKDETDKENMITYLEQQFDQHKEANTLKIQELEQQASSKHKKILCVRCCCITVITGGFFAASYAFGKSLSD